MPKKSIVGSLASKKTKSQFSEELSSHTQLRKEEVDALFPKKSDRDELVELLSIVNSAAEENEKKAILVEKASRVSGALIKVVKTFAPGI